MRRILLLLLLVCGTAFAQTNVTVTGNRVFGTGAPGTSTPLPVGLAVGVQYTDVSTGNAYVCTAAASTGTSCTTWTAQSGRGSPAAPTGALQCNGGSNTFSNCGTGVFNFAAYGAVGDDSTDNCSGGTNAVALFTAAVNAYSGPGMPIAIISDSPTGKAYKLATNSNSCTFQFTNPKGTTVHLWGNLDCAQTAQACIILGPTNTAGSTPNYPSQGTYRIDGNGFLLNGANLTNVPVGQTSSAGIYVEPQVINFTIQDIGLTGAGNTYGFGATNSTLGSCTNYGIFVDYPVADGTIKNVYDAVAATNTTTGGCGFGNPNGAALGGGTNTIQFEDNVIGTPGTTACGSVGILDGGSYGSAIDNILYGFGMDWRLQGKGHRIVGNVADAAGCAAHSIHAIIHVGVPSSSTAIPQVTITDNQVQARSGDNFITIAGDSTATLQDWVITDNVDNDASAGIFHGTPSCTPDQAASACYVAGNQNFFTFPQSSTGTATGWGLGLSFNGIDSLTGKTANVSNTALLTSPVSRTYLIGCQVISTNLPTGATLPACNLSYTDLNSGVTATPTVSTSTSTSAEGTVQSGFALVTVAASGVINFNTSGYAAGSGTALQYAVNVFAYTY